MTLNGVKGRYLCDFTDSRNFGRNYVTLVEVRSKLSATKMYSKESSFR